MRLALYWLLRGGHVRVLRRPPAVINAPGASDMNREWRMLVGLGYGRLRHGMGSIAKAQRALDMAAGHALERETFG